MDDEKHTPGPWVLNEAGGSFKVEAIEEARANAHLIAAAPDLLAALEIWLDFANETLSEFATDEVCGDTLCPKCEAAGCIKMKIDAARAAIAKARATSPQG